MKKISKWILSITLIICIIIPSLFVNASTGFTQASDVNYVKAEGKYVVNWGDREEDATFLSTYAQNFYKSGNTFDEVIQLSGGTTIADTPKSELYAKLKKIMTDAHSYVTSYAATRDLYKYTDCIKNDYSKISSFYSGDMFSGVWDSGATWNREHTWPNSKGDLSGNGENDIMMLRPTLKNENGSRSNKAYGTTSAYYNPNVESGGKHDLRGDVSRIILYQYTRWGCINTGSKYNPVDIFGTSGVIESLDVLLDWMEEDPVDTWEMGRNDAVQSITGTRNVFVDYPEYAWALFGEDCPDDMVTPSGNANNIPDVPNQPDTPIEPEVPDCENGIHVYDNAEDLFCNECGKYIITEPTLLKEDGVWYYYNNGIYTNESTLVKYKDKWFYVTNGQWDSTVEDLVKYNGKWFYIYNGKWSAASKTLFKKNSSWFYISKGKWDSSANCIFKYKDKDFYISGGKWKSTINTLYKKDGKYFSIMQGKWYKGKNIIKYDGKKYYVNNGYAQTSFSGKTTINGKKYTVKKGIIQ